MRKLCGQPRNDVVNGVARTASGGDSAFPLDESREMLQTGKKDPNRANSAGIGRRKREASRT